MARLILSVLGVVHADYQLSNFYAQLDCGGAPIQTVANYLGCLRGTDGTNEISFFVTCINASAFDVDYFEGFECSGPVIHTASASWGSGCQGSSDGKSTYNLPVCTPGSYTPASNTVNTFVYSSEHTCPLEDPSLFSAVVSIPKKCHAGGGAADGFFLYGCDKENVTAVPYSKPDCSGKPSGPPIAIGALGCADPRAPDTSASFTTCGAVPTASTAAAAGAAAAVPSFGAATSDDTVGAAVAAGVARALETIRERRA